MWLVNRISMNVNAAFSSFCRFYVRVALRRYLHLEERHAQHDRHARLQRLLQTVVVVQHKHAERNVLPGCVSRPPRDPLSILFSACSTKRAHVNTPSGASDYASRSAQRATKSWYDAISSWMYSQMIAAVFLKSVMPLVLVLPESTRESSLELRCTPRNRITRRTPGSGTSRGTPRHSRGTPPPSSASPRTAAPTYFSVSTFRPPQCLEENSVRPRIRAGVAHAAQVFVQLHQLQLHRTGSPRNTVTFPCAKSCCCSSCSIDWKGARNISSRPGTLSISTSRVSEA